jgi:hypothetical protein
LVGEQDTFLHILEYENYAGYDKTTRMIQESKVCSVPHFPRITNLTLSQEYSEAYKAMLPFINTRTTQLNQEFAFFPTAPPHTEGGLFELRTYQLKPGTLLEWEATWCVCAASLYPAMITQLTRPSPERRRGIEARRQFVAPVGAWFSQIGRLHQTHHLWQYP